MYVCMYVCLLPLYVRMDASLTVQLASIQLASNNVWQLHPCSYLQFDKHPDPEGPFLS